MGSISPLPRTIGWGCTIYQLRLRRGVRPHPNECPEYHSNSDGEVPVILKPWGMQSTPSWPSLQSSLWSGVVALDRVLSMGQIELFDIKRSAIK